VLRKQSVEQGMRAGELLRIILTSSHIPRSGNNTERFERNRNLPCVQYIIMPWRGDAERRRVAGLTRSKVIRYQSERKHSVLITRENQSRMEGIMASENDVFDEMEDLMVEDARKTYSPKVIDHFLNPRNVGELENADCSTFMSGICGDTIGIYVGMKDDRIERIGFVTNGCGPTIACSSALTCMAKGLTIEEAKRIPGEELMEYLGGLPLENTHCADLAVNTLRGALAKLS
jgi:nitrogen fixation protein NifU and related proteins